MTKIVINQCYGGFDLSPQALAHYHNKSGTVLRADQIARDCPHLVSTVLHFGIAANTDYTNLKVVTIPPDVVWQIMDYDGCEWIAEQHRTWQ